MSDRAGLTRSDVAIALDRIIVGQVGPWARLVGLEREVAEKIEADLVTELDLEPELEP